MKPAMQLARRSLCALLPLSMMLFFNTRSFAEPLTLKHAVELALIHSPAAGEAGADEARAYASYRETRDQFIPQLLVGSGLGDSWGYPLSLEGSAPSLVNVTAQSALFSPALRDGMHAARSEYKATQIGNKDRRNQIIQETTVTYLELLKWEQLTDNLREQHEDAIKTEGIVEERIKEGVDSAQQRTEARLVTARAKLHLAQAQGSIDTLKSSLSQLTGLPEAAIEVAADSVPGLPEVSSQADDADKAVESNPTVQSAQAHAIAVDFRAKAEHKALLPSVDFATQYAVLAKFNNWLQFFPTKAFERNNATVGIVIRFPFFNASQHAHAEAADADAIRARKELQSTKNQVSQEILKLQHGVEQLRAAREVSELEYEIAKSNVDAVEIRTKSGTSTVHDAANTRTEMFEKYSALQDADFQLLRARIGLLRATGDLESWVERGK
jgi:outer membrane protein TolC